MKQGLIKITDFLYKEDWDKLYIFFKDFRPIHIEMRYWENNIWYLYGVSELFDELKEGEMAPQYDVVFTKHEDGSLTYKFEKV